MKRLYPIQNIEYIYILHTIQRERKVKIFLIHIESMVTQCKAIDTFQFPSEYLINIMMQHGIKFLLVFLVRTSKLKYKRQL